MTTQLGGPGPRCDICGDGLFVEILNHELVGTFRVEGVKPLLFCHVGNCKDALDKALAADKWEVLPSGPLRKAFSEAQEVS